MSEERTLMEEFALVLDYLPRGKHGLKDEPTALVIGTKYFTLLEVIPNKELKIFEKVYIGKENRDKIKFIKRRISYDELTAAAQAELEAAVEKIVKENPKRFLDFYNNAQPITIRMHQLELLPGLGKKHLVDILEEREKKPFESFEDIEKRVPLMPDPLKAIIKRIIEEIQGPEQKHYLFVRPHRKKRF
mgnify:FL=1